jgi:hypothetical protein
LKTFEGLTLTFEDKFFLHTPPPNSDFSSRAHKVNNNNNHKLQTTHYNFETYPTKRAIMPPSPTTAAMLRRKSPKRSTNANNNNNSMNDSIVFDFDCQKLEDFMFNTMSEYCDDLDLIRSAKKESIGLAERMERTTRQHHDAAVALNVIEILQAFMNASPRLPTELVYEAHCYIGLLWIKQSSSSSNNKKASIAAAQCSFTKALWIVSSAILDDCSTTTTTTASRTVSREQVALTMHRLGRLEGERGNYGEAIALVEKALDKYEQVLLLHRQRSRKNENTHGNINNSSSNNHIMMNQQLVHAYILDARNATSDWNARLVRLQADTGVGAAGKLKQQSTITSLSSSSCRHQSAPTQLKRLSFVREETSESSREFQLKH